jgi:hypothetical protein
LATILPFSLYSENVGLPLPLYLSRNTANPAFSLTIQVSVPLPLKLCLFVATARIVSSVVPFNLDKNLHTYRMEVKGNTISFLIDGAKTVTTTDNQYLEPGEVGLWCSLDQIAVRSFKITAL